MAEKYSIEQKTIENILGFVRNGEIAIPEIQRPFVWSGAQVRDLIDSLYRGYPAGYIIVWQNPDVKLKDGTLSLGKKILIDGQQRVTAIMTAIDGRSVLRDDYSSKQIKIAFNPWAADEEPSFEVQTPVHIKDKRWIADISVLFKKDFDDYEFIEQYVADNPGVERKAINAKIRELLRIEQRQIGVIQLSQDIGIDEVTEIFVRINSQGKILNEADFAMSKIAADNRYGGNELRKAIDYFCHLAVDPAFYASVEKDASFMATPYAAEMKWLKDDRKDIYDPEYSDMLRVALMHKFGRGRLKDLVSLLSGRDFKDRTFKDEIMQESFAKLESGVHNFVKEYHFKQFVEAIESAGFISSKLLRSQMSLDFAYTLHLLLNETKEVGATEIKHFVRRWFVLSTLTGRYSGSPESQMDRDLRAIAEKGVRKCLADIEAAELGEAFWTVNLVQQLETSAAKCPALNVFKAAQVFFRDQSLFSVTAVANLIDTGDVHHIFPKEFLKSNGLRFTQYNQVANFTYLETPINIAIGKKSPSDYFGAVFKQCETKKPEIGSMIDIEAVKQTMEMNCVPEDVLTMSVEDYESRFLTKRRELMAAKIRKYYEVL